jgi:tetratricopeptide (TPR) repeat protein
MTWRPAHPTRAPSIADGSHLLAVAQAYLGDASGQPVLEDTLRWATDMDVRPTRIDVLHGLGVLASHLGEHDRARDHLRASLATADEIGYRPMAVFDLIELGANEIRAGQRDAARAAYARAADDATAIGMVRSIALAEAGLAAVDGMS